MAIIPIPRPPHHNPDLAETRVEDGYMNQTLTFGQQVRVPRLVRVAVEHRPGVATLVGRPNTGGLAYAGRFASREAALIALLCRGLSRAATAEAVEHVPVVNIEGRS